ncbi:TetR family transcriptional regulator [Komagataeibacter nataicola]|uniref:TetR family transcriptional regulator n=2 Tax=Komagataeibacter nataicola TaxID=265960 RepID=A0A9N7C7Z4_9PROT|nr:TetR/AcrR family transcriptional regulator [Komagataeibacter nataicola]AQU87521.1 TetR family transcriptional regulator [Komagataeibacter nataicola]PYD65427.1 TetR family transcriptional regulator [Komagataeibacter nataicola]WEQ55265.1 WHG domain-containing protein [Komagataeibacter nataicola]WNM09853.1 WHG domain-containing protein [Komagataeibacter nataicola]GBR21655.1 TetR family transcriptional regulator [Komagataeibacter nataicola NRIC 0616]
MTAEAKSSYHHGDLHKALLHSARTLLERDGIGSLKLRAITRHAGVSATAAVPHFGNLTGLLSALAAQGFDELAAAMSPEHTRTPQDMGLAYVRFAIDNPSLFTLMFRSDAVNPDNAALAAASTRAFDRLITLTVNKTHSDVPHEAAMAALWAKVHGLAVLAIDGLLLPLTRYNGKEGSLDDLISKALS